MMRKSEQDLLKVEGKRRERGKKRERQGRMALSLKERTGLGFWPDQLEKWCCAIN